jgi:hypothetical protein
MSKVIVRMKGGLGNQLFCYAAARRLAMVNGAELVIDDVTGFVRDTQYRRRYMLDRFNIKARKATPTERMEPFERCRRALMKYLSCGKPFGKRSYLEQGGLDLDERLLTVKVKGTFYLDGLWQSESYFKDIEKIIREDLRIDPLDDVVNQGVAQRILGCNAVAVHVRWFDVPGHEGVYNISKDYYQRAIDLMEKKITRPHYFLFSDDPVSAQSKISFPDGRLTCVAHNGGDEKAYADLWLMSQCRHFITANSTFSWWGAWLGQAEDKIVVAPEFHAEGKAAWGFKGLIPPQWTVVNGTCA